MNHFASLAAFLIAIGAPGNTYAQDDSEAFAGLYDGSQSEIAAALELSEDGRYRYQLAYGALDEWSAGTWTGADGGVVLQSDPFTAPEFSSAVSGNTTGRLSVKLDLSDQFDPQYFAINLRRKDGSASINDMASGSLDTSMGDNPIVSVRAVLPVLDLIGPEIAVPEGGATMTIAFKPNDLGFAGFSKELLRYNGGTFELPRYGLVLRFRKVRADP